LQQIEMRLIAALSNDKRMTKFINDGMDVHIATAEMMYGHPYDVIKAAVKAENPTPEQKEIAKCRKSCKTVGFGLAYGETEIKLITQIEVPGETLEERLENGRQLQQRWLDQYPDIRTYIDNTRQWIQSTGYVNTILGWRRHLPAGQLPANASHMSEDALYRFTRSREFQQSMRAGVNATIQGSAADVMKLIQLRIWRDPYLKSIPFVVQAQVHDELVAIVDERYADAALKRCLELAHNPLEDVGIHLAVDIEADGGLGKNWLEAK